MLEEKALDAIVQYDLIHRGDRIAVGVSGGADSVALLAFFGRIRADYELELVVCHLNHGLRGAESDRDESFVRELAAHFGLPMECRREDVAALAAEKGCSLEEAGRAARYALFAKIAGERGLIATAHTLSDSMETLLLNLTRGTGLRGLCGIPWRRGNIIRPLLGCTREETEAYVASCGLGYVNDSTNAEDCYTRNKLRHRVLPELLAINPALPQAMERLMRQLCAQWAMTESLAETAQQQLAAEGGGLARQGLLALPEPVGDRLLLRLLEQAGLPLSAAAVERMRHLAERGGQLDIGERRWFFVARGDRVWVEEKKPQEAIPPQEIPFPLPSGQQILPIGAFRQVKLTLCYNFVRKEAEFFHNCPLKNKVDCDRIKGNLTIRTRRPGDRQKLPGREGTKPLGKRYAEAGIPPQERDSLLVLADEEGLLWTEAFGADARACVSDKSKNIMIIEVLEEA